METNGHQSPERIRASLDHPIVDADGHWLEFGPVLGEELRRIGGDAAAEGFLSVGRQVRQSLGMSVTERRRRNAVRLWGAGNPAFFEGTSVAAEAAAVLAATAPAPARAGS